MKSFHGVRNAIDGHHRRSKNSRYHGPRLIKKCFSINDIESRIPFFFVSRFLRVAVFLTHSHYTRGKLSHPLLARRCHKCSTIHRRKIHTLSHQHTGELPSRTNYCSCHGCSFVDRVFNPSGKYQSRVEKIAYSRCGPAMASETNDDVMELARSDNYVQLYRYTSRPVLFHGEKSVKKIPKTQ